MFQSKLLKILLAPFVMHVGDESGGGGAADAGGFDMASAVDSISEGLGFGEESSNDDDSGNGGDGSGADDGGDGTGGDGDGAPKGDAGTPPATKDPANPAPAAGQDPNAQKPADGAPAASVAPRTWRPEATAAWESLPQTVKDEVLKREEDMFRGLEAYKQDAGLGKAFVEAIRPHLPVLKAVGADPFALAGEFMQAHITFATGTAEAKHELLSRIVKDYGLDLSPFFGQGDDDAPYSDPQVKLLRDQVNSLKSQLSGMQSETRQTKERQEAEARASITATVEAFASDPANIYYKELEADIAKVLASGLAKDLPSAYAHAVMMNPVTQAKELARRTTEASTKAAAEAKAKAEAAARAAGANVKLKPKSASAATPMGSIDDTLNEVYAKITGG